MSGSPLTWLTCAPRDFAGDEDTFFSRDTGLLTRGLQACGVHSRAILIGAPRPDDAPDLVRVSLADLASPVWWSQQGADAVILQTWSLRHFTPIAAAIRAAGSRLILIQDSGGITGPLAGWWDWVRESAYMSRGAGASWRQCANFGARMLYGHSLRLPLFERGRARQFHLADLLAVPSPPAVARYRQLARRYGGAALAGKVRLVPHAVAPRFQWSGSVEKENRVAAIGRWEDHLQKRPDLLTGAIEKFISAHPGWIADIFGTPDTSLLTWHAALPGEIRSRVLLHSRVTSQELVDWLQRTRILFCSSSYESFHIASAEALCSGASVVGVDSGMTATHRWFASKISGTLSPQLDARHLAEALAKEAAQWSEGQRDASLISAAWCPRLHAPAIAAGLLREVEMLPAVGPR